MISGDRLATYAYAQELDTPAATPMQSSMSLPLRSRPISSADLEKADSPRSKQDAGQPARSPSKSKALYWADSGSQPKIFPGIVHERTRRSSIRQGSGSEKDAEPVNDVTKARGTGQMAPDGNDFRDTVMEDDAEDL